MFFVISIFQADKKSIFSKGTPKQSLCDLNFLLFDLCRLETGAPYHSTTLPSSAEIFIDGSAFDIFLDPTELS